MMALLKITPSMPNSQHLLAFISNRVLLRTTFLLEVLRESGPETRLSRLTRLTPQPLD
jgi:hypothetical protein